MRLNNWKGGPHRWQTYLFIIWKAKKIDTIELNDAVFGVEVNEHLVHMAVVQQLANNRQGTQKAKTRSEVSGGGRKPWRQKGTGHARQGSIQSSPVDRRRRSIRSRTERLLLQAQQEREESCSEVCSDRQDCRDAKLIVVDELKFEEIKTKNFAQVMKNLDVNNGLVVVNENDVNVMMSAKNIADVKMALPNTINVYDIMKAGTGCSDKGRC